jgi:hypothetical protein
MNQRSESSGADRESPIQKTPLKNAPDKEEPVKLLSTVQQFATGTIISLAKNPSVPSGLTEPHL